MNISTLTRRSLTQPFRVLVAGLWLAAGVALAAEPMILTSASKQFTVRGLPQRSLLANGNQSEHVYVDPALLIVTSETVKRVLQRELLWEDRWQGKIVINVHPLRFDREPPEIVPFNSNDGWGYRVEMPDQLERERLMQCLVEVLLLEFANRAAGPQVATLPPWLTEGLTAHLMEGPLAGLTLYAHTLREISEAPQVLTARTARSQEKGAGLRQVVQEEGALNVDQLNWPEFNPNDPARVRAYHHSAHLFVRELLRLRGGPDALSAMLALLPEHLNWQTAFLRGFNPRFRRLLDVEKWWAVAVTQLKTHDNALTWSGVEAQRKLEEAIFTPLNLQSDRVQTPRLTPVALQTVIRDWEFKEQVSLLQTKLVQLQLTRLRLPPELGALADSYRAVLEKYLRVRARAWFSATGRTAAGEAIAQLNALDAQREKLAGKAITTDPSGNVGVAPLTPP